MSKFMWDIDPQTAWGNLWDDYVARVIGAIHALMDSYAPRIEAWMKENAPWTDRTGNLRQSLYAFVEQHRDELVLAFDYGLEYGVYLEYGNFGAYGIIGRALDHFWPSFVADLQRLTA
jgi:hypothetical protein